MILVEPEYLPSVNYFKIFSDNQVTIDYDVKFSDNPFFNRSRLVGDTGVFEIKIPTVDNSSTYLRDIKIDYSKKLKISRLPGTISKFAGSMTAH